MASVRIVAWRQCRSILGVVVGRLVLLISYDIIYVIRYALPRLLIP